MSKFSKNRPINTDFAKFQRQPSISKLQQNIDKLILASKLSSATTTNTTTTSSQIITPTESALNVENVYNCEVEVADSKNDIEGKKELDTIEKFIDPEPITTEEIKSPQKRITHFADVVIKIRNQGFLERIKKLKELRDNDSINHSQPESI